MTTYETSSEWETPELEFGEAESESAYESEGESENFLGGLLSSVLGGLGGEVAESESPLSEVQEMEAANALLETQSEEELEQFLGSLVKKVASGVGGFLRSGTGQALTGALKNVAKKALPMVGGALGSFVAPGVGTALGSKLGSMASNLFEMEFENMSEQEAEFEAARRYVRFASSAAANAAKAPRNAPPQAVARAAVVTAARKHAPGLVRGTPYQTQRRPGTGPAKRPGGQQPSRGRTGGRRRPAGGAYGYPVEGPTFVFDGDRSGDRSGDQSGNQYRDQDDDGYDDQGYHDEPVRRRRRAQSGRWVRRGHKIMILGS
ncbi:hypothetical protein [Actinoplanes sp. NPDC020271]|uniref:hypothetical protein n=1 Tax=Actinoplanes sp. NPDC020271 TaxID=3363896 RepID=UPI0037902062